MSNSGITEEEFEGWHKQCEKDGRDQVTRLDTSEARERLMKADR